MAIIFAVVFTVQHNHSRNDAHQCRAEWVELKTINRSGNGAVCAFYNTYTVNRAPTCDNCRMPNDLSHIFHLAVSQSHATYVDDTRQLSHVVVTALFWGGFCFLTLSKHHKCINYLKLFKTKERKSSRKGVAKTRMNRNSLTWAVVSLRSMGNWRQPLSKKEMLKERKMETRFSLSLSLSRARQKGKKISVNAINRKISSITMPKTTTTTTVTRTKTTMLDKNNSLCLCINTYM